MKFSLITNIEEISSMYIKWNQLLNKSFFISPFLRNEYQVAWWQLKGGGELEKALLAVLVAHDKDDNLIGIAPFYITKRQDGKNSLRLLGGVEISDYLDILVKENDLEEFWKKVFEIIFDDDFPKWNVLEFYNISEKSPSIKYIKENALKKELSFEKEIYQPCPQILLPKTWNDYLNSLNNKFKKNLTRRMRIAENHYVPVKWEFVNTIDFDERLNEFFELMATDPEKHVFLTKKMRKQMELIVRKAFDNDIMQFAILKLDEKMISGLLYFDLDGKLWGYNSALDLSNLDLSPGLVLKGYHIQWAIEQGYQVYDFMRGNESYKYDFGGKDTHVLKITINA